ncbi:MAG TPA: hypothetical protein VGH70_13950 [Bradyrhizobium sp.]
MNARNEVKRPFDLSLDARLVLAAVQLRFAARVDFLVARWLERCATNLEVTQGLSGISAALVRWTARLIKPA